MKLHFLNCFTCSARLPDTWRTGALCILAETPQGLVLVDTGPGMEDYRHPPAILRLFQVITRVPMDPAESAVSQIAGLGFNTNDLRHIVLTHMHFDHCGGLADFPEATVHVHRAEYEAFLAAPGRWAELAYVRRHIAHRPRFALYEDHGEFWQGLPAISLPLEPQMWLVPLPGHTRGHCGIAIRTEKGWHFHVGDAGPVSLEDYAPRRLVNFVMGPHVESLRKFAALHPEIQITTGHMWLNFFDSLPNIQQT